MICYAELNNQTKPTGGNSGAIPFCVATPVGFFIGDNIMRGKVVDIAGQEFGYLTVLYPTRKGKDKRFAWLVQCCCGKRIKVAGWDLKVGHAKSCGCRRGEFISKRNRKPKGQAGFNALYTKYKKRAKERNLSFSLTKAQFKILSQQKCSYCNVVPRQRIHQYTNRVVKPDHGDYVYNGIDRLNSRIGYTKDNCVPCCGQCNWGKGNMTSIKFLAWIKSIYENHFIGKP